MLRSNRNDAKASQKTVGHGAADPRVACKAHLTLLGAETAGIPLLRWAGAVGGALVGWGARKRKKKGIEPIGEGERKIMIGVGGFI